MSDAPPLRILSQVDGDAPAREDDNDLITRAELDRAMQELHIAVDARMSALRAELGIGAQSKDTQTPWERIPNVTYSREDSCSSLDPKRFRTPTDMSGVASTIPDISVTLEDTHDVLEQQSFYKFHETTWDTAAFIGTRTLGRGGSFFASVALLLTILSQLTLSNIVRKSMVKDPLSDGLLTGLEKWRKRAGHDIRNFDVVTQTSLVTRVCQSDVSLEMSTMQQNLVDNFRKYLGMGLGGDRRRKTGEDTLFGGPTLCLCVVSTWLLYISVEARHTFGWLGAVYHIPRSKRTVLQKTKDMRLKLRFITSRRFVFIALLALIRLGIAIYLGLAGIMFLVYTIDLGELMTNAMALTFILDIDELLYMALLPRLTRLIVSSLTPIPTWSPPWRLDGADRSSLTILAVLIGAGLVVNFTILAPVETRLHTLVDIACGDATNFVFTLNPSDRIVEWATSSKSVGLYGGNNTYAEQAVNQLINADGFRGVPLSRETSLLRVMALSKVDAGHPTTVSSGADCQDRIEWYQSIVHHANRTPMLRLVLSIKVGKEVKQCSDVREYCDQLAMLEVRSICPVTCGCDNITSGLFLGRATSGCPSACLTSSRVEQTLASLPCADPSPEALRANAAWERYWQGFAAWHAGGGVFADDPRLTTPLSHMAMTLGCGIVTIIDGSVYDCDHNVGAPLFAWCPVSCGCVDARSPLSACPHKCNDGTGSSLDSLPGNATGVSSNASAQARDCRDLAVAPTSMIDCDLEHRGLVLCSVPSVDTICCEGLNGFTVAQLEDTPLDAETTHKVCCIEGCLDKALADPVIGRYARERGLTNSEICGGS